MADGANTDVEQTWNSCCDAGSCSDAVRQQGWQTLQELRRQKDSFTDGQVWLCGTSDRVVINAFPLLLHALTRAIHPQKAGPFAPCGRRTTLSMGKPARCCT
jgi:hypothetical protein